MAQLRVFLLDLMAMVHREGETWMILPDERAQPRSLVHYPIVLFDADPEAGNDWKTIKELLSLNPPKDDKHAWLLDKEDIVIPAQSIASPLIRAAQNIGPQDIYPTSANARSLEWVPKLNDVRPGGPPFDPSLTAAHIPAAAAARLCLHQGVLKTATFVKVIKSSDAREIMAVNFNAGAGVVLPQERAVAEMLVATIHLDGNSVEIGAAKNGSITRSFTLRATPGQEFVNMLVANLSPIMPDNPTTHSHINEDGSHFNLYYGLTNPPSTPGPIPSKMGSKVVFGVELNLPTFINRVEEHFAGGEFRPICAMIQ